MVVGFSVSRGVRRAVDRNKAKRVMRESYRLHKHLLAQSAEQNRRSLDLVFMYTGRPAALRGRALFAEVDKSLQHILRTIAGEEE